MPTYRMGFASRPGSKHAGDDAQNQDAGAVRRDADGVTMVVCDGAGSQRHSRHGADLTVRLASAFLAAMDWDAPFRPQVEAFLADARAALAREADERGVAPRELACTVIAAVAGPSGWRAFQVGDGFLVTRLAADEPYRLLFPITKGEYANETVFVTQASAVEHLQVHEGGEAPLFLCLSTDGMERQAIRLREGEPHPPFFDYLFKVAASNDVEGYLARFLAMPAVDEATDDDRTLACALRE